MDTEDRINALSRENARLSVLLQKKNGPKAKVDLTTIQGCVGQFLQSKGIDLKCASDKAGVARSVFYYTKEPRMNLGTLIRLCEVAGVKASDVILLWEANQKKEDPS